MSSAHQSSYLESKVLTASSHKLHLMLIEGALRSGRAARQAFQQDDRTATVDSLLRMFDIVGEMLAGVRGSQAEINQKLANLYAFVLRSVAEARLSHNIDKLDEALSVLEYERETWKLLCDRQDVDQAGDAGNPKRLRVEAAESTPVKLHLPAEHPQSHFSCDA